MIAPFEFATATRILFGRGTITELPSLVARMNKFVLLVTGKDRERSAPILEQLRTKGLVVSTFSVDREPTIDLVIEALQRARQDGVGAVVSVGGGSVIDTGKAVAALLTNFEDLNDYLEVIGRARPLEEPPAPFVAVPTTSGTGAEVTRNAVMTSPEHGVKVSLRSPLMLPSLALVDPNLTCSMPPAITASTGLDALTQVIEPFVSPLANPLADAICREGMRLTARSLLRAYRQGDDMDAREDMALAGLYGGLALANSKLGAAHGFAGTIGGMFPDVSHGFICARMLPQVMEANIRAIKERDPGSGALERFDEIARILTGDPDAKAIDGVIWIQMLCSALEIPPLSGYGLMENEFNKVAGKARRSSSMQGNPIKLSIVELTEILSKAVLGS